MTSHDSVVLLHGVGLDRTMWQPAADLLRRDGFEVLTPDLPGHGANPPVAEGTSLADLAGQVAPLVPAGSHVVGFSLGALIAQHLARFRPDLVATLTSVSSVCRRTPAERAAVLDRLATAGRDFPAGVAASLQRWYPADDDVDPDLVRRTEKTLLANDTASYLRCYRVFATADAEIGPELDRITVPALAVTGDLDPGSTPEMTRRLARAIPGCVAHVVPGARHMWPAQRPQDLTTRLTTFWEEIDA
ncbi:alpha/beta fold hydrolase [Kineococcus rhizosphaerae]|uniref:Pimeloyl-ACP methyl ester carboxylesterase n=1 Tax=Kineococcus rhizosphaerae TaxID=559628 RepID=A0A2T0R6E4_9ACTN|nr:alpha/beta hydrolase [Kineococcus rhizosphaerae]PRY16742.1 pimeloyl-ACP methyl ester carboxylesterase [Kineococcus rhizosphaerae]